MSNLQSQLQYKKKAIQFSVVGDPGEMLLTEEQAAKLMGVCFETFEELEAIGEGPSGEDGFITLADISYWVESRYKKFSEAKQNKVCCMSFVHHCS